MDVNLIVFKVHDSNATIRLPANRLKEFALLKLLHSDNVDIVKIDELTPALVRDVQYYIDTGMIARDETVEILELLGNDVNPERLPRDMVRIHLAEQNFRKKVNASTFQGNNFDQLIELTRDRYEQMVDTATAYRELSSGLLKSGCDIAKYSTWGKIQRQVNNLINRLVRMKSMFPKKYHDCYMICGGSIASIVHDVHTPTQDIDVFIASKDDLMIADIMKHYSTSETYLGIPFARTNNNVISILERNQEYQIIKRAYKVLDQILYGFDVDASCIGLTFDGRLWMTPRFEYAFMKNCLVVNIERLSLTYELRLAKYYRRGWDLYVPGTLTKSIPAVEIELNSGQVIKFSELESDINPKWFELTKTFESLSQSLQQFLLNKLKRRWRRFNGIDILWIATRPGVVLNSSYYRRNMTSEINTEWLIDHPDTQHTGSFQPLPRDTKWFNFTVDTYVQEYLPVTQIVDKYNLHRVFRPSENKHKSYWRTNMLYQLTRPDGHGPSETIYAPEFMLYHFKKKGFNYSDFKPTNYLFIHSVIDHTMSYVMDISTELIIGKLHKYQYGAIVNIYIDPALLLESHPLAIGEDDIPKFKFAPDLIKDYFLSDFLVLGSDIKIDFLTENEHGEYFLEDGTGDYARVPVTFTKEFVKWFNR